MFYCSPREWDAYLKKSYGNNVFTEGKIWNHQKSTEKISIDFTDPKNKEFLKPLMPDYVWKKIQSSK